MMHLSRRHPFTHRQIKSLVCRLAQRRPLSGGAPRRTPASPLRRSRPRYGHVAAPERPPTFGRLQEPFTPNEQDIDMYLKKTSLSPWVPLPDAAARKLFDLAAATPEDVHVDLGSGDGRVCFHAIDYGIRQSTGIDIDQAIVEVAQQRLAKRHPQPDLEFVVADLMDESHPAWQRVQQATILTMYFAQEALKGFRPILEGKLAGHELKVITCGYEMPGWEWHTQEVVLGMPLHLYEFGTPLDDHDDDWAFMGADIIENKPEELTTDRLSAAKFDGAKVIDRTTNYPIRGFNPNIFEDDGYDSDWSSDDEKDEADAKR